MSCCAWPSVDAMFASMHRCQYSEGRSSKLVPTCLAMPCTCVARACLHVVHDRDFQWQRYVAENQHKPTVHWGEPPVSLHLSAGHGPSAWLRHRPSARDSAPYQGADQIPAANPWGSRKKNNNPQKDVKVEVTSSHYSNYTDCFFGINEVLKRL